MINFKGINRFGQKVQQNGHFVHCNNVKAQLL